MCSESSKTDDTMIALKKRFENVVKGLSSIDEEYSDTIVVGVYESAEQILFEWGEHYDIVKDNHQPTPDQFEDLVKTLEMFYNKLSDELLLLSIERRVGR